VTKRLNIFILAGLLLVGLPYYWLLLDTSPWNVAPRPVSIAQLRTLAAERPGPMPVGVAMERTAFHRVPGNIVAAGTGIKRRLIAVMTFRLDIPGQPPVLIDAGMTRPVANLVEMEAFDTKAQARVLGAIRDAGMVLALGEDATHLDGLGAINDPAIAGRLRLSPSQVNARAVRELRQRTGARIAPAILDTGPQAVAPGIVVIPAPSHTASTQMIYVRLASGTEYLFTGDVAPLTLSWQEQRIRSRYRTDYQRPEDRASAAAWLRTVDVLKRQAPRMHIVPGNDIEWLLDPIRRNGIVRHFPAANQS
jgi:glyoxylase-like metal-dependent hydrolase (beta-lactamase superfamily II)